MYFECRILQDRKHIYDAAKCFIALGSEDKYQYEPDYIKPFFLYRYYSMEFYQNRIRKMDERTSSNTNTLFLNKKMKKILYLLIIIFITIGCNEVNNLPETHHTYIKKLSDEYNGYSENEVVSGCLFSTDYFFKLLLKKDSMFYVTSKAYSVKPDDKLSEYTVLYVRKYKNFRDSNVIMYNWLIKVVHNYFAAHEIYFKKEDIVAKLTKDEYEEWMKKYPQTQILHN